MAKKKYEHPLLDFWSRNIIIGTLLIPLFWDLPAKVLQAGIRTVKYGDHTLGSSPAAMMTRDEAALSMGVGEATANASMSFFGSVAGEKSVADKVNTKRNSGVMQEGASFPPKGEFYRDTQHLNSAKQGDARLVDPFYVDTRHKTQTASGASIINNPDAYTERGWVDLKPSSPRITNPRPADNFADQRLVDVVQHGAVFAGINGVRRLR